MKKSLILRLFAAKGDLMRSRIERERELELGGVCVEMVLMDRFGVEIGCCSLISRKALPRSVWSPVDHERQRPLQSPQIQVPAR